MANTELQRLQDWIESKKPPSTDELAGLSGRITSLAHFFDQTHIRGVLIIRRHDNSERELTNVPNTRVEHFIRFSHKRLKDSDHNPKATSPRIISCFLCPDLKHDVRLYVACGPTCEKFIRLNRTSKSDFRLTKESIQTTLTWPLNSGNSNLIDEQVTFLSLVSGMPEDDTLPQNDFQRSN